MTADGSGADDPGTDRDGGLRRRHVLEGIAGGGVIGVVGLATGHGTGGADESTGTVSGCDLAITKNQDCGFEYGEDGLYTIQVCNVGSADCTQPVTVTDDLPSWASYQVAQGTGWSVSESGGTVTATHSNQNGVGPGTCLPVLKLEVGVAEESEFPSGTATNCASVSTGDDANDANDQNCEDLCLEDTHVFMGGEHDHFAGGTEPTEHSEGLQARIDNYGQGRVFDEDGINAAFGHSFLDLFGDPNLGEICGATLEIALRPEQSGLVDNDALSVGFFGTNAPNWHRYLGNGNGEPGLFDVTWDPDDTGPRTAVLDLDALPLASGGTQSLISAMNHQGYLDVYVQDDTVVDYARLTVEYCCDHELLGECDLVVEKRQNGPFTAGGNGSYTIDVCNVGDGECTEQVTVTDDLPAGLSFDAASGAGWYVTENGGTVTATHAGGVAPGDCLPTLVLDLTVAEADALPDTTFTNCVSVSGGDDTDTSNNSDCVEVDCVDGSHTLTGGEHDGYAGKTEPASPSPALVEHLNQHHGRLRDFDEGGANAALGHTFTDLQPSDLLGEICGASLEIGLRPVGNTLERNDTIHLGFRGGSSSGWGRYLGTRSGQNGLYPFDWRDYNTSGEVLTLDLDALPEADGTTTSLIHQLNDEGFLDVIVQDDTAVDHVELTLQYCCRDDAPGECDLRADKTTHGPFHFGETGQYDVAICNHGDSECVGEITVVDQLPPGVTFSSADGTGWSVSESNGTVTATHPGPVPPQTCLTLLTIEVDVGSKAGAGTDPVSVQNCVDVAIGGTQVHQDCLVHDITTAPDEPDLDVVKMPAKAFTFDSLEQYLVDVTNVGDLATTEPVHLVDALPDGIVPVGVRGEGWQATLDGQVVQAHHPNVAGLDPSESLPQLTLDVQVAPATAFPVVPAPVENCIHIEAPLVGPDGNDLYCVTHDVTQGGSGAGPQDE